MEKLLCVSTTIFILHTLVHEGIKIRKKFANKFSIPMVIWIVANVEPCLDETARYIPDFHHGRLQLKSPSCFCTFQKKIFTAVFLMSSQWRAKRILLHECSIRVA